MLEWLCIAVPLEGAAPRVSHRTLLGCRKRQKALGGRLGSSTRTDPELRSGRDEPLPGKPLRHELPRFEPARSLLLFAPNSPVRTEGFMCAQKFGSPASANIWHFMAYLRFEQPAKNCQLLKRGKHGTAAIVAACARIYYRIYVVGAPCTSEQRCEIHHWPGGGPARELTRHQARIMKGFGSSLAVLAVKFLTERISQALDIPTGLQHKVLVCFAFGLQSSLPQPCLGALPCIHATSCN